MELKQLFEPARLAVFCDSRQADDPGLRVVENLVAGGYLGELVIVDPQAAELFDHPCLRDPRDHPNPIELAVISTGPDELKRSVDRAVQAGARAVVLVSWLGPVSGGLVTEVRNLCQSRSVRLVGPGSPGVLNPHAGLNASCAAGPISPGGVALVSESGALFLSLLEQAADAGLGISKAIGLGDKVDLDEVGLFRGLAQDPQTRVVIAYLEGISAGNEFLKRAEALASLKPVIVLKAGITAAGQRAAVAHTGRTTSAMAFGAAFRRAGVIQADSLQSLLDCARLLASQPLPRGNRVAVVTDAGGPGILAADAVEQATLKLADPWPGQAEALGLAVSANPIELERGAPAERLVSAVEACLAEPSVDAVLLTLAPSPACPAARPLEVVRRVVDLPASGKPLVVSVLGGSGLDAARGALSSGGLPVYTSPKRAISALEAARTYAAWRDRPPRVVTRFRVNRQRVERILRRHERQGLRWVQDHLACQVLEAYDFHVPRGLLVDDAEAAIDAADRLGLPVSLSIVSPEVSDKLSVGGVRNGLINPEAVRDAFDLIMLRLHRELPRARVDGVWVERELPPGRRVVVGMVRDAQFGPMLLFGHGGGSAEVMQDVAFHLAPITADEARQMLRSTRAFKLLQERQAAEQAHQEEAALIGGLQRISQLATDFPRIQELQIDPFVLVQGGAEPLAAAARIRLAAEGGG